MNDRELLELAAKAAGMPHSDSQWSEYDAEYVPWNPLDDDGDALRLAVKLRINSNFHAASVHCSKLSSVSSPNVVIREFYENDPLAATRQAIVRAAAEIGRNMT